MKIVDARGLSCPEPVILTKRALLTNEKEYEVQVDNTTAVNNVTRFSSNNGFDVTVEKQEDYFLLKLRRKG